MKFTSKRITGSYFNSRAFFKADISNNRTVVIPEIERRVLSIEKGDKVNLVAVSPDPGTQPIYAEDVNVISKGQITIPKEGIEKSKVLLDGLFVREELDVDIDKLQVIVSKDDSIQSLIDSRAVPNKKFLFNSAIFKTKLIDVDPSSSTLQFTIPKIEREIVGINEGDKINVVVIDASDITFNRRNIIRLNVINKGGGGDQTLGASIPATRVRIGNMRAGADVQIVARPP